MFCNIPGENKVRHCDCPYAEGKEALCPVYYPLSRKDADVMDREKSKCML